MKQIWVLCGGPSTEYEVSLSSGRVVCEQMNADDREITPVIVSRRGEWIISDQKISAGSDRQWLNDFFTAARENPDLPGTSLPKALSAMLEQQVDCVFLVFHGQYGEDGGMQGFLQTAGIPYTGSGILSSAGVIRRRLLK